MKKFLAAILVLTLTAGIVPEALGEEGALSFELTLDKQSYRLGEPIWLVFRVQNMTSHDLLIPGRLFVGKYLRLRIVDSSGRDVPYRGLGYNLPRARLVDFLVLGRGHFYGKRVDLVAGDEKFDLSRVGSYTLECSYENYDKEELLKNHESEVRKTLPYFIELGGIWSGKHTFDKLSFEVRQ